MSLASVIARICCTASVVGTLLPRSSCESVRRDNDGAAAQQPLTQQERRNGNWQDHANSGARLTRFHIEPPPPKLSLPLEGLRKKATQALIGSRHLQFTTCVDKAAVLGDVDLRDNVGRTLLHVACDLGRLLAVQYLLSAKVGARAEATDRYGSTALEYAAKKGHAHVVHYLCREAGMHPDGTHDTVYGFRPIHKAVAFGQQDAVAVLLHFGANPNQRTGDITAPPSYRAQTTHETPLCLAARLRKRGTMHVLLSEATQPVAINAGDDRGNNPLRHAVRNKDMRAIALLLAHGASTRVENEPSYQPYLPGSPSELSHDTQVAEAPDAFSFTFQHGSGNNNASHESAQRYNPTLLYDEEDARSRHAADSTGALARQREDPFLLLKVVEVLEKWSSFRRLLIHPAIVRWCATDDDAA